VKDVLKDFESRPLKGKDLHKPIYEKEMMEILHALKKFHPYLIGRHFKVKTDVPQASQEG
jgi:hypothetical protein